MQIVDVEHACLLRGSPKPPRRFQYVSRLAFEQNVKHDSRMISSAVQMIRIAMMAGQHGVRSGPAGEANYQRTDDDAHGAEKVSQHVNIGAAQIDAFVAAALDPHHDAAIQRTDRAQCDEERIMRSFDRDGMQ